MSDEDDDPQKPFDWFGSWGILSAVLWAVEASAAGHAAYLNWTHLRERLREEGIDSRRIHDMCLRYSTYLDDQEREGEGK